MDQVTRHPAVCYQSKQPINDSRLSISKVFDPGIYTVIDPPWERVDLSIVELRVAGQSPPCPALSNARWGDWRSR